MAFMGDLVSFYKSRMNLQSLWTTPREITFGIYPHNEVGNRHGCLCVHLSMDTNLFGAFFLQFCTYCSEIYT